MSSSSQRVVLSFSTLRSRERLHHHLMDCCYTTGYAGLINNMHLFSLRTSISVLSRRQTVGQQDFQSKYAIFSLDRAR